MRIALEDVGLQQIAIVYPGTRRYRLAERIAAVPMREVPFGWQRIVLVNSFSDESAC